MGACSTVSFTNFEIGGIRVADQYHCAGTKSDTICGICCYIVEELIDGIVGCFYGRSLLLTKFAESNKEFVIDI